MICKEFSDMNKQQVWCMTCKSFISPNHRCIKNKWVFKINRNSVYQVHLIACGYNQLPGVNFSKNYFLVVNNITFCILLLMVPHFSYSAQIVDIEMADLYRDLEEEICMECPQGMPNIGKDDHAISKKCIYSLVQAARQYYKKLLRF